MEELPPSLSCIHTATCSTSHPATGMIPHGLAPSGWDGAGEALSLHSTAEWALLFTGLNLSLCSPTEPWIPLSSVLSLEHREWPLEMLLPGSFPCPSKVQPYCRFLPGNPGAEFPQKQRETLYLKEPHRYEFHLQMGESLPGYRKFWGQHC